VRREAFVRVETARGAFTPERVLSAEATAQASYDAVGQHLEAGLFFDALLCFNDIMAAGALRALLDAGVRVPDGVAVIGHDDVPMAAWLHPPLSTLKVLERDLGVSAVRTLLDRLNGHRQAQIVLKPELIVRTSSGIL
jgi:LacI family transcriptional regulator